MALKDFLGPIGDVVSTGLGAIGGYFSNVANAKENEKNRQWNEKMWNLANQYNLPVNQMQRLKDARLNPNLVYGDGASTLASYAGNLGTQKANENPLANARMNFRDIATLQNETKVANAQAEALEAQAFRDNEEGMNKAYENEYKPKMLQLAFEKAGIELSNLDIENTIKMATQNAEIARALTEVENLALDRDVKKSEVKIKAQELLNKVEELNNLQKMGSFIEEQTNTERSKQGVFSSEAALNDEKRRTELVNQAVGRAQEVYYKDSAYAQRAGAKLSLSSARYYDELAKNQPYVRNELSAHAKELKASVTTLFTQAGLNKAQASKAAEEVHQMIMNGQVDRLNGFIDAELKNTSQRYGTGAGVALGAVLDMYQEISKHVPAGGVPGVVKKGKRKVTKGIQRIKGTTHNHGSSASF